MIFQSAVELREISRDLGRKLAPGGPYLWIVDDLPPDLDQQRELPAWCAPTANGCTLITTRSKDYLGLSVSILIDSLEPQAALQLLTQQRKPQSERERADAAALAEDLGRHALALDVAGHFLLKTRDFAAVREELTSAASVTERDPLGELVAGLSGQLPGGHEKSIVATLLASVRPLADQALNLLRLACELRSDTPIPYRLAKEVLKRALGLEERAAEDYLSVAVIQSDMHSLARTSLSGRDGDAFSVHTVVQYTMRHGDPAGGEAAVLRRALRDAAVPALIALLQDAPDVRKHALMGLDVAHAKHLADKPSTDEEAVLARRIARFEHERGNLRESLAFARRELLAQNRLLGADHPETLGTRLNIALVTGLMGREEEALSLLWKLLPIAERVLGPDHPDTLGIRGNIAIWTPNADEALRLARELLADNERVLGPDHPHTLENRANIAQKTAATGATGEALELYRQLLCDEKRVFGPDDPATLRTRGNIALQTAYSDTTSHALELFGNLLADQEQVLGPKHADTVKTRYYIASLTEEPREKLRRLLEILPELRRVLGPEHPLVAEAEFYTAYVLGYINAHTKNGKELLDRMQADAVQISQELLLTEFGDQERVLGPDHPDTLRTRFELARWIQDSTEALRQLRELLPLLERVLGPDHQLTLTVRVEIAYRVASVKEQAGEALQLCQDLLPDLERVLSVAHPQVAYIREVIAVLQRK
jgi:tetratricopeptide (TPR) repeat protein